MGFIARVLVGFIISTPITVILAGGVQNAASMLVLSIVCTAGIGLVFWIPVWLLVGVFTVDVLFKNVKGKSDQKQESVPNPTELPKLDYLALTAYIGRATASGMDLALKQANAESVSGYFFGAAESDPALLVA